MAKKKKSDISSSPLDSGFEVLPGLVKKYFHTFDEKGRIQKQGYVLSEEHDDFYLVQYFDWILGEPSFQKLIPIKSMVDWHFYSDREEMIYVYAEEQRKVKIEIDAETEGRMKRFKQKD